MGKKHYVSLKMGKHLKQLFYISYTSDGGFFIQDLLRLKFDDKKCLVNKVSRVGTNEGPIIYSAQTSGDVKLTHHFDGCAHISGEGVLSRYENGVHIGASIKSFPLYLTNDGGPVFSFLFWGSKNHFRDSKGEDIILQFEKEVGAHEGQGYAVYGYYILKENRFPNNLVKIQSPENVPGNIGLHIELLGVGFEDKTGFTLSGGPGFLYNHNCNDMLVVKYPFQDIGSFYEDLNF